MSVGLRYYRESKKLCRCRNPWKRHYGFRWKDGPYDRSHHVQWPAKGPNGAHREIWEKGVRVE